MEMWERLTEEDIQELVDTDVAESLELEYKACGALQNTDGKKNEVSKDVSSFANAGGGTIIYGVIEKNHEPDKIDEGYDQDDISREWLENVITSRIHPKIEGVKINPIKRSNGKYIYLVYVPQGHTAHQAHNRKYYRRHNFKSEPMWDYEIKDVQNRVSHPALEPKLDLRVEEREKSVRCILSIKLVNQGGVLAKTFGLRLQNPQVMVFRHRKGFLPEGDLKINGNLYTSLMYRNPSGIVIFPQDEFLVTGSGGCTYIYDVEDIEFLRGLLMYWHVFADNAPPNRGEIDLLEFHAEALYLSTKK